MPDINAYLSSSAIDAAPRAVRAWRRIQQKPTSITVSRNGVNLSAQTVRLDWQTVRTIPGVAGEASERRLVILGVADHPNAAILDTDLALDDRFRYDGSNYTVVDVVEYPGEIQVATERQA